MIIEAPSPSRKTIGAAISSSAAQRPSGMLARKDLRSLGGPNRCGHLGHHDGRIHAVDPDAVFAQFKSRYARDVIERRLEDP